MTEFFIWKTGQMEVLYLQSVTVSTQEKFYVLCVPYSWLAPLSWSFAVAARKCCLKWPLFPQCSLPVTIAHCSPCSDVCVAGPAYGSAFCAHCTLLTAKGTYHIIFSLPVLWRKEKHMCGFQQVVGYTWCLWHQLLEGKKH